MAQAGFLLVDTIKQIQRSTAVAMVRHTKSRKSKIESVGQARSTRLLSRQNPTVVCTSGNGESTLEALSCELGFTAETVYDDTTDTRAVDSELELTAETVYEDVLDSLAVGSELELTAETVYEDSAELLAVVSGFDTTAGTVYKDDTKNVTPCTSKPVGRRLWTMTALETLMTVSSLHGQTCHTPSLKFVKEKQYGLRSMFRVQCETCKVELDVTNESKDCTLECNRAAVWAGNATGTGFTDLQHSLAALDVPFMTFNTYKKLQDQYSAEIAELSYAQLLENGAEERKLAVELDHVDPDGVVWTEVEGDAAWSKRSYNQQGNSMSGSAVIIGLLTGKPLYADVKNKYCYVCDVKRPPGVKILSHKCFKNFTESASAMESAIILDGFKKSIEMHNLRYKTYLGDGDSSVFLKIRHIYYDNENSYKLVEKVECKNHALRCFNKNLRKLLGQTAYPIADRKELGKILNSIGKYCVYSIECAKELKINAGFLRLALKNCLEHVYGIHKECQKFICQNGKIVVPTIYRKQTQPETTYGVVQPVEDSKYEYMSKTSIWRDINKHIGRLVDMAGSLVRGQTTNSSECFQGQLAKFLQGKRKNVVFRGAHKRKSDQAVLASVKGPGWCADAARKIVGKSPLATFKAFEHRGLQARTRRNKRPSRYRPKQANKLDVRSLDPDYGTGASRPDEDQLVIEEKIKALVASYKITTKEEQWEIHQKTVGQFDSLCHKQERENMLTASLAGKICRMQDTTLSTEIIESILRPKLRAYKQMNWGKDHEKDGIAMYKRINNVNVEKAGLFRSLEYPMLAASPDGLVGDEGLVEVKCPWIERYKRPIDVATRNPTFMLLKKDGGDVAFELRKTHEYYYQVVMQLHITNRSWCDFVVWTQGPLDSLDNPLDPGGHVLQTRIYKSSQTLQLWHEIKNKLIRFFKEDLAPEIVDSRAERNMALKQPAYRLNAIKQKQKAETISKKRRAVVPRKLILTADEPDNEDMPPKKLSKKERDKQESNTEERDTDH